MYTTAVVWRTGTAVQYRTVSWPKRLARSGGGRGAEPKMRLLRAAILALAGILPVTGAGPPQKMYPVGGLDPEIGEALKAAVASHVRGL